MLAVTLPKGGVGKSTTAVNLAAAFANSGRRVLLVDTDTQGQTAGMLGLRGDTAPAFGLADVLDGSRPPAEAVAEARPGLDLLAGGDALAGAAREIARRDYAGERVLAEALTDFSAGYALTIVDTAPGWDSLAANVLFYASELLAPVSLDVLAADAFARFVQRVEGVQRYRPGLALRYVLPTMYDRRVKAPGEVLSQLEAFAEVRGLVCLPPVRYSVRLAEAPAHGQTVYEYAPGSPGAEDYAEAARRILDTPPNP